MPLQLTVINSSTGAAFAISLGKQLCLDVSGSSSATDLDASHATFSNIMLYTKPTERPAAASSRVLYNSAHA